MKFILEYIKYICSKTAKFHEKHMDTVRKNSFFYINCVRVRCDEDCVVSGVKFIQYRIEKREVSYIGNCRLQSYDLSFLEPFDSFGRSVLNFQIEFMVNMSNFSLNYRTLYEAYDLL